MNNPAVSAIKRSQKESLIYKIVSHLFVQAALDDPRLSDIFVNRAQLSPEKGACYIYFYSTLGEDHFKSVFEILKLYKPSMRKALAAEINARYTPEIIFDYDRQFYKQCRIESLLDKIKEKENLEEE